MTEVPLGLFDEILLTKHVILRHRLRHFGHYLFSVVLQVRLGCREHVLVGLLGILHEDHRVEPHHPVR